MSSKLLSWLLFLGTAVMVVIVWKIVTASPGAVWVGVALFMVAFFVVLGIAINGEPLGALISEQNVMSLARFQAIVWTVVILSAYFVVAMARIKHGVDARPPAPPTAVAAAGTSPAPAVATAAPTATPAPAEVRDPLNIKIDEQVLYLIGISATSLVASPLIAATKKSKQPDTKDPQVKTGDKAVAPAAADALAPAAAPNAVASGKAEGILFKNTDPSHARFTDIFEGDELANNNHVDLGKVQMFFFTIVVAVSYAAALAKSIRGNLYGAEFAFPSLSAGMVGLLAISNAGYLANKSVDHTKKVDAPGAASPAGDGV